MLVVYRERDGRDAEPVRPAHPAPRTDDLRRRLRSSQSISRTGHRIAAGTERGVEIYDGFTGEQVDTIPGDDLRGVFITVTDQLFVSSLGGELTLYDLDSCEPIRTLRRQPRLHHPGGRHRRRDAHRHQRRRPQRHPLRRRQRRAHRHTDHHPRRRVQPDRPVARRPLAGASAARPPTARTPPRSGTSTRSTGPTAACRVAGRNLTRDEWASNIGTLAPYRATCPDLPVDG